MKTTSDDALVTVCVYNYEWEAHMACNLLADNNIPAIVDNTSSPYPLVFAKPRVLVFSRDFDRARALLEQNSLED